MILSKLNILTFNVILHLIQLSLVELCSQYHIHGYITDTLSGINLTGTIDESLEVDLLISYL